MAQKIPGFAFKASGLNTGCLTPQNPREAAGRKMIKGEKVALRPIRQDDFPILHKWINDPKIVEFWYGCDKPRSMKWVKKHFTDVVSGEDLSSGWIVEAKGKPIGFMYNTPDKDDDKRFTGRVELDIMIGETNEQGKGHGVNALKAMITYAFEKQGAERVYIIPQTTNVRAIHVYEKVGFKREGVLRHFEKHEGEWFDSIMMAIIKEEFKK